MRLFLLFTLSTFTLFSQQQSQSIGLSISRSRLDYYASLDYGIQVKSMHFRAGLAIGVNRVILQKAFSPKLLLSLGRDLLPSERWILAPTLYYTNQVLVIDPSIPTSYWQEALTGVALAYGRKFQMTADFKGGWIGEFYKSRSLQKYQLAHGWGYDLSIGIRYVF